MYKINDAHLHCDFTKGDKEAIVTQLKEQLEEAGIQKALLYLINEKDYEERNYSIDLGKAVALGIMLNPKESEIEEKLLDLQKSRVKLVKLLPYEQQLFYEDVNLVCEYAMKIQKYDMVLTICGAYGTKDIYRTNGVEMAASVLNAGFRRPLIIAHGGMPRILDVYSLMCEYGNLYMDISFIIPFWWESHIIQDLYFVMKNLDFERIFWGSDYPFHSYDKAISYFDKFCDQYQIAAQNKEKLLKGNFEKFYCEYLQD